MGSETQQGNEEDMYIYWCILGTWVGEKVRKWDISSIKIHKVVYRACGIFVLWVNFHHLLGIIEIREQHRGKIFIQYQ